MSNFSKKLPPQIWFLLAFFCATAFPLLVGAQAPQEPQSSGLYNPLENVTGTEDDPKTLLVNLVAKLLEGFYAVIIGLAILMIVIGGIIYMVSGGNEKRTTLAKNIIVFSIIGVAVVLGSAVLIREIAVALSGGAVGDLSQIFSGAEEIVNTNVPETQVLLTNIINFALGLLGLLGVIGIVIGGFWYLTSAGNEDMATLGRKTLTYSIIGVALALTSMLIVKQIANLF